jgi:hypothetical protein
MKQPIRSADLLSAILNAQATLENHLVVIEGALQRQNEMLADQAALAGEHSAVLAAIERRLGVPQE